jgi:hypothetical protein
MAHQFRFALALMLAGGVALATDTADAKSKRYKKPKERALVAQPYVPPGVLNERECVTRPGGGGAVPPYHFNCEAAFRRLYSR